MSRVLGRPHREGVFKEVLVGGKAVKHGMQGGARVVGWVPGPLGNSTEHRFLGAPVRK